MRLYLLSACVAACSIAICCPAYAENYYVDQAAVNAADTNAGTLAQPWKTISRAAAAAELRPGDKVLIKSGVYREAVDVTVSGAPGKPITFAAAPGARVVIKGSTIVKGDWQPVAGDTTAKEPYPNAFSNIWKIHLDAAYFQDSPPDRHCISTVYLEDGESLQEIGRDFIYTDPNCLSPVGQTMSDMYLNTFYFDRTTDDLFIKIDGQPGWSVIEVGTTGFPLQVSNVHDVNIDGIQVRDNRQPGGQWPMCTVSQCQRVVVENCSFSDSDFCGLSIDRCEDVDVLLCSMNRNGDSGLSFSKCTDCKADGCLMNGNNTRHFNTGWHAGGSKCIPSNIRVTIENCEAAYNDGPGIWFDTDNTDCRIIHDVTHDNNGPGIMYEINPHGGLIADNLTYRNKGRGIYVSGSEHVDVVDNTVAENDTGIVIMPREDPYKAQYDLVQDNLFLGNYIAGDAKFRGCDLTLFLNLDNAGKRGELTNHSNSNLYALEQCKPTVRAEWNNDIEIGSWQKSFGEDPDSREGSFEYNIFGDAFKITDPRANVKRAIATPLPAGLPWKPTHSKLVGSSITSWPAMAP